MTVACSACKVPLCQYGCFFGGDGKLLGAQIIYLMWLTGALHTPQNQWILHVLLAKFHSASTAASAVAMASCLAPRSSTSCGSLMRCKSHTISGHCSFCLQILSLLHLHLLPALTATNLLAVWARLSHCCVRWGAGL